MAHYNQFTSDREISYALYCTLELGEKVELIPLLSALFFSLTRESRNDISEFDKIT